jgi:hypothetical protein
VQPWTVGERWPLAPVAQTYGAGTASGSGRTVEGTDMNGPSRTDANYNRDRVDYGFNFGWLGLAGLQAEFANGNGAD